MESEIDQLKTMIEEYPTLLNRISELEQKLSEDTIPVKVSLYAKIMQVSPSTVRTGMKRGTLEYKWIGRTKMPMIRRKYLMDYRRMHPDN